MPFDRSQKIPRRRGLFSSPVFFRLVGLAAFLTFNGFLAWLLIRLVDLSYYPLGAAGTAYLWTAFKSARPDCRRLDPGRRERLTPEGIFGPCLS